MHQQQFSQMDTVNKQSELLDRDNDFAGACGTSSGHVGELSTLGNNHFETVIETYASYFPDDMALQQGEYASYFTDDARPIQHHFV